MLRLTTEQDVAKVLEIIQGAQQQMGISGIPQWQDGYPNATVILEDISQDESFVYEVDGEIAATTVISTRPDSFYDVITDGEWLTNGVYGVIHRIAVAEKFKGQGIIKKVVQEAIKMLQEQQILALRIDTHAENKPMLGLISAVGFTYCGVVFVEDGSPRNAYELVL